MVMASIIFDHSRARQLVLIYWSRPPLAGGLTVATFSINHESMIEQLKVQKDYIWSRMATQRYLPPLPPKPKVVFGWHGTSRTHSWVSLACCLAEARKRWEPFCSFHAPSAFSSPPKSFIYRLMWRIGTNVKWVNSYMYKSRGRQLELKFKRRRRCCCIEK